MAVFRLFVANSFTLKDAREVVFVLKVLQLSAHFSDAQSLA